MIQVWASFAASLAAPVSFFDGREVVHEQRGEDGGDDDQRDVDPEQHARAAAGADDRESGQLDDRDADVAAARVEAERPALLPQREEGVDVGHGGGEVAAADAGQQADAAGRC